jgi:hypothetical protein
VSIDTSGLMFPKNKPAVLVRKEKQRTEAKAWRSTKATVDKRDEVEGAPVCFITGKRLQNVNPLDEWTFRDRAHLDARSKDKKRRYDATNVISVSRGVHNLIDKGVLLVLDKRHREAKTVRTIDHLAWNRNWLPKGTKPPCRIRKGLAVVELADVKD